MVPQESDWKAIGIHEYKVISTNDIPFEPEIRKICEDNVCRLYGKTWACPPAVGTVEQCKERCLQYKQAMVFSAVYPLEDCFDYEGMKKGHKAFKELCDRLYMLIQKDISSFHLLSNEGCKRCDHCTYPSADCRKAEMLFPSLEGYGINVMKLAQNADLRYNNGKNKVTYFGMLLY